MQYETEEQQVEAIKAWWKENGLSIMIGVAIGLIGVFGWRTWISHRDMIAGEASGLFTQLTVSVENGKNDVAGQQAATLRSEYADTPYAAFAELMIAKTKYEQKDTVGAQEALKQAIIKAPNEGFTTLAVLRLARLQLSVGDISGAAAILDKHPAPQAFTAEYAAVRGDIARAQNDIQKARAAYMEAITGKAGHADLIQLKLDNLPPVI